MRIKKLEVTNFRALRHAEINLSNCSALIGENNSGKSAFLLALDLFFSNSPQVKLKDFSDEQINKPIDITVHFSDFTSSEAEEFRANLVEDELIVTRRLLADNSKESGKFFVTAKVNPEFSTCRNEEGKTEKRQIYKDLQKRYGLPDIKSADEIDACLEAWESDHQDELQAEKVAGFKGWKNVAIGKLKHKTDYVFIRAVEDAAENIQGNKNSPVRTLINTVARQTIENSAAFKEFLEDANRKITELTDPAKVPILAEISENLTAILASYYKDSGILASWDPVTHIQPALRPTKFCSALVVFRKRNAWTGRRGYLSDLLCGIGILKSTSRMS